MLNFGQDLEAVVWSRFRGWSLVETLKLNFDVTCFGERTLPLGLLYPWHGNVFSQYLDSYLSLKIQVIQIYAFSKCDVRAVWTSLANFLHTLSLFKGCKVILVSKGWFNPCLEFWPEFTHLMIIFWSRVFDTVYNSLFFYVHLKTISVQPFTDFIPDWCGTYIW